MPSQSSTPVAQAQQQQQQTTATPPPVDPFASLVSASPRNASPFQGGKTAAPAGSSLLDLAPAPATQPASKAPEEDEWDFTSSLPESNALPSTNRVTVLASALRIEFVARRSPQQPRQIQVVALFSNAINEPMRDLHFQVAVEKVIYPVYSCFKPLFYLHSLPFWFCPAIVPSPLEIIIRRRHNHTRKEDEPLANQSNEQAYTLHLRPQSGRDMEPQQVNGVQQEMMMDGVDAGKGNSLRMRFRVSYQVGGKRMEEQGMVPPLGIA